MPDPLNAGLHTIGQIAVKRSGNTAEFVIPLSRPIPAFDAVRRGSYWKPFRVPRALRLQATPPASEALTEFVNDLYTMARAAGLMLAWRDRDTVALSVNYGGTPAATLDAHVADTTKMLARVFGWDDRDDRSGADGPRPGSDSA